MPHDCVTAVHAVALALPAVAFDAHRMAAEQEGPVLQQVSHRSLSQYDNAGLGTLQAPRDGQEVVGEADQRQSRGAGRGRGGQGRGGKGRGGKGRAEQGRAGEGRAGRRAGHGRAGSWRSGVDRWKFFVPDCPDLFVVHVCLLPCVQPFLLLHVLCSCQLVAASRCPAGTGSGGCSAAAGPCAPDRGDP